MSLASLSGQSNKQTNKQTNKSFQGYQALGYAIATTRCFSRGEGGLPTDQRVAKGCTITKPAVVRIVGNLPLARQNHKTNRLRCSQAVNSLPKRNHSRETVSACKLRSACQDCSGSVANSGGNTTVCLRRFQDKTTKLKFNSWFSRRTGSLGSLDCYHIYSTQRFLVFAFRPTNAGRL